MMYKGDICYFDKDKAGARYAFLAKSLEILTIKAKFCDNPDGYTTYEVQNYWINEDFMVMYSSNLE